MTEEEGWYSSCLLIFFGSAEMVTSTVLEVILENSNFRAAVSTGV